MPDNIFVVGDDVTRRAFLTSFLQQHMTLPIKIFPTSMLNYDKTDILFFFLLYFEQYAKLCLPGIDISNKYRCKNLLCERPQKKKNEKKSEMQRLKRITSDIK